MPEPALPSVTYADYKRAIRGSKRKNDTSQSSSASMKEEAVAYPVVKSSSSSQNSKKKGRTSIHSGVKASKDSSSLLQNDVATSSAQIEKDVSQQNTSETNTHNNNNTDQQDEGFEVLEQQHSGELETSSLTIQHTISGESESPLEQKQNNTNNNRNNSCDEGFEVHDSTLIISSQRQQGEPQHSTDNAKTEDPIQITESISFKSADDSIFSTEGQQQKESPPRKVVHTAALASDSRLRLFTTSAIDMTGCIRKSDSPESSSNGGGSDSTRSNNIRQLGFPHSPNKKSSSHSSSSSPEKEEVSSEPGKSLDQRWQDFGASLTLLGAPVLSWFSATTSDGVVANDDEQQVTTQPTTSHDDKDKRTRQDSNSSEYADMVLDTAPVVDDTCSSSSTVSKKKITTSSLSSTDQGSLSSHDGVVGETTPRAQIALPRQLSRLFSAKGGAGGGESDNDKQDGFSIADWSQKTWNKVVTSIPSKDENPKRWYQLLLGLYLISASIFITIMVLVMKSGGGTAAFMLSQNSSDIVRSSAPTVTASVVPSDSPSLVPSNIPTNSPTITGRPTSSRAPSTVPSEAPSHKPSIEPSGNPTMTAMPTSEPMTYVPGKLTVESNGLKLSEGLTSRIIARSGQKVLLDGRGFLPTNQEDDWNHTTSSSTTTNSSSIAPSSSPTAWSIESDEVFHFKPDGAAAYLWPENDDYNGKGWVYVSNSEVWDQGDGGVGAIYFDDQGRVVDYKMLINGTTANCSGGKTPWHTWVTCEEADDGRIYQVDPLGIRPPEEMTIGMGQGKWESFAYDIRDQTKPRYFATEDKDSGTLRRFTPDEPDWDDPWTMLQANGTVDFLIFEPFDLDGRTSGTFFWTTDLRAAKENARRFFRNSEGIDVRDNQLFVVSKVQKELFILDLDAMTYEVHSTVVGLFDGQPDQMKRLISDDGKAGTKHDKSLLYFCEEGGRNNGIHARDSSGWYFTVLESDTLDGETSGLAFSPDGKHMYFSYQHRGIIFDVWREDGRPFHGKTLSVKYHETGEATIR
ncbi:unnamed protein product [Cylindrotheca closterium]|uniref:Uncharacterized protein n=1 Tax=Cylindrotheca closterium TaxID=2856 RepID=A0AAD2PW84_9STRA|nr:unnamed protein product [Cylindrotheca closterium]